MRFSEIIGHSALKKQLCSAVRGGRIPHAQIFTGVQGIGKLQLALAYAQYVNCPHRTDEDSCGQCPSCLQFQALQHPDLHFVFPIVKSHPTDVCDDFAPLFRQMILDKHYFGLDDWHQAMGVESKQSMIYENESEEILRKLSLKAFGDGYKIMVIWLPEKMHLSCANKLLKLLEEPPEKTLFLMVGEHPEMLLSTISSRVQQIRVPSLTEQELVSALMQRHTISEADAQAYAHIASGSYLAALRLLESSEAQQAQLADFIALFRNAYTVGVLQDPYKKFEALNEMRKWSQAMADSKVGREKQKTFLQYAQSQVRENFIRNLQQPEMNYQTPDEQEFSVRFARFIHSGNVELIMNELEKAERQIEQNGNAKIIFFDLCIQMIVLIKKPQA